jgi:hypothetical protein
VTLTTLRGVNVTAEFAAKPGVTFETLRGVNVTRDHWHAQRVTL